MNNNKQDSLEKGYAETKSPILETLCNKCEYAQNHWHKIQSTN